MNDTTALQEILNGFRDKTRTEREKGTAFELLILEFLSNDKTYSAQFSEVLTYKEWAESNNLPAKDIGIDLVAKNADDEFCTAIQCKFYAADKKIDKKGIDSFIAASDNKHFNRRLFVDTTSNGITDNVITQINNSKIPFTRIGLDSIENSSIDWDKYIQNQVIEQKDKKQLRPHQSEALKAVQDGLKQSDRGKLIMACGTGKTFTSLKIAEKMAGAGKSVLFLAPSLSLVSQTVTEWTIESDVGLHALAVCSDKQIGKRKTNQDDTLEIDTYDLAYPATTDAKKLAAKCNINDKSKMTVVFATYQSIGVISKAQEYYQLGEFDLIICDEAHRTTGVTSAADNYSNFVSVHDKKFVAGRKRIYMTATPRVYISQVKKEANKHNASLYSMDDEDIFGKELYTLKFGDAVENNLLSDYKVIVLALDEKTVEKSIQTRLSDSENNLTLDDATKIIGCYKALSKAGISDTEDTQPMRKVVAFSRTIKASKLFKTEFNYVVKEYLSYQEDNNNSLNCEIQHVDGTMNTAIRNDYLSWLKSSEGTKCNILSNVRCLSEGVDVPSLDAVLFVHSRKSKIDIVQSVGRVMRIAKDKKLGYVILPIVIPAGIEADKALDNNKNYEVVWDVLNALRSHDERLDADINQAEFGKLPSKMEIISEVDTLPQKASKERTNIGDGSIGGADDSDDSKKSTQAAILKQQPIDYKYDSVQKAILAKIVEKCGTRTYWEDWAVDVAEIAGKHIVRIKGILKNKDGAGYKAFQVFFKDLRKNVNIGIQEDEVIEMLAQHIITKPVFDALFNNYDFANNNPVSKAMQGVLDVLDKHNVQNEAQKLEKFYTSIKRRVAGVDTAAGKQKIVIELYDKFFKKAFPKMTERLGIVYTPVECVDFIIHSVNDILQKEFGQSLGNKNTNIIDPFTGTGTFITRLIQSGIISQKQLKHKYKKELHANEIVLLAYYIAAINIETSYFDAINQNNSKDNKKAEYAPFNGICLTDTFQLSETNEDLITPQLPVNSERLNKQKGLDIKVIIGNPPYSAKQKNADDNNANLSYPKLDESIKSDYVKTSLHKGNKNSLYDSYIRAIKWASDKIGNNGVIGFITNAGWLESTSSDGMRKCLADEFSDIYVFHLRGDARTSGETRQKEAGNIFGVGSRTPVAISILVKNPNAKTHGNIHFYDIGDYKKREEKLKIINDFGSIAGIKGKNLWQKITPDKHNDWLNLRDDSFYDYMVMGDNKNKTTKSIFTVYSSGLKTNRDAWVYNCSKAKLTKNMNTTIDFYNSELQRYKEALETNSKSTIKIKDFVNYDTTKIAWNFVTLDYIKKNCKLNFENNFIQSLYRPFTKQNCYYSNIGKLEKSQMPKIFPEAGLDNLVIGVSGKGANSFNALITNLLPELHSLGFASQCFPLKLYEPISIKNKQSQTDAFNKDKTITMDNGNCYKVTDGISDDSLKHFSNYYPNSNISKKDVFYYIYGLLHSEDYRKRFANNLVKGLPHIPRVKDISDFMAFSTSGKTLADLHLNYETKEPYPVNYEQDNLDLNKMSAKDFYVEKIRFKTKGDKSAIIYNKNITITDIPLTAFEYVVNSKSAVEWVMERQSIITHKDSQIVNNPNDYAIETINNPRYPLDLLLKVIAISVASVDIIKSLPKIDFESLG